MRVQVTHADTLWPLPYAGVVGFTYLNVGGCYAVVASGNDLPETGVTYYVRPTGSDQRAGGSSCRRALGDLGICKKESRAGAFLAVSGAGAGVVAVHSYVLRPWGESEFYALGTLRKAKHLRTWSAGDSAVRREQLHKKGPGCRTAWMKLQERVQLLEVPCTGE